MAQLAAIPLVAISCHGEPPIGGNPSASAATGKACVQAVLDAFGVVLVRACSSVLSQLAQLARRFHSTEILSC